MKKIHYPLLLVAASVCSIVIPFLVWAQEADVKDSHILPSGYGMKIERMGGYLGGYSVFWIYPYGQVINGRGKTAWISSDFVEQLLETNTPDVESGLAGASVPSLMGSVCFDCFTYSITIYDKEGTRVRAFLLSAGEVGKTFPGLVNQLQRLAWLPFMGEPEDPDLPRRVSRPPLKVGVSVQESKLIKKVEPVYPELAQRARVQGRVVLAVIVDEEGNVTDIEVVDGHPLLDEAAKTAVSQWKYSPTLLNGEPVPVSSTVTLIFSLTASGETAITEGD